MTGLHGLQAELTTSSTFDDWVCKEQKTMLRFQGCMTQGPPFLLIICALVCSWCVLPSEARCGTQDNARIGLHLSLAQSKSNRERTLIDAEELGCRDDAKAGFNVYGEIGKMYVLYLIAFDLDPNVPLKAASFGIDYNSDIAISRWETVASQMTFNNSAGEPWPSAGSANILVFEPPGGASATAEDPGRETSSVLGFFYLTAYSGGYFEVVPGGSACPFCLHSGMGSAVHLVDEDNDFSHVIVPDHVGKVVFSSENYGLPRDPCIDPAETTSLVLGNQGTVLQVSEAQPNPFRSSAAWTLTSSKPRDVSVSVFDVRGGLIRSWGTVSLPEGVANITWDGKDETLRRVPSGVYFLVAEGNRDSYRVIRRAVLLP